MIELAFSRHRLARRLGHQHCECCRHGIAVSERNQEPANAAKVDGRKAVLDVEVQHHGLADVRGGIGGNRAALDETVRLFAFRQLGHKLPIEGAQYSLQPAFGRVDQALAARSFGDRERDVMRHRLAMAMLAHVPQLSDRQRQRRGHVLLRLPHRQLVTLELSLVGRQVHHIAVARAQGWTEQPIGFALGQVFDLWRRRPATSVGIWRRLRKQAVVA